MVDAPTLEALILGDSHTAALRRGQATLEARGDWPAAVRLLVRPLGGGHLATGPFFADRGDHAEITLPEYRRHYDRLPRAEDPAGTVYGLSGPLHSVRLWRAQAWADFAPADLLAEAGAAEGFAASAPVSSGLVGRLARDDQGPMLALAALLRRIGRRVFVVEAPRPFRHHPALRRTPAAVAMRVDRLYRDAVRTELRSLGVAVVAVPEAAVDADGFTRAELGQAGDPHHGNEAYGALMMGEILAHLAGLEGTGGAGVAAAGLEKAET